MEVINIDTASYAAISVFISLVIDLKIVHLRPFSCQEDNFRRCLQLKL